MPPHATSDNEGRVAKPEQDLDATRAKRQGSDHNLEIMHQEQKAISEKTLSVRKDSQSADENLLIYHDNTDHAADRLCVNEDNAQDDSMYRFVKPRNYLNIIHSIETAILLLDSGLNLVFFTPTTKPLFNIIAGDIGHPLSELSFLGSDGGLVSDAKAVLKDAQSLECEVEAADGVWFRRRVLPYRAAGNGVEGVLITFSDITERRLAANALEEARRRADWTNVGEKCFVSAAVHDLRQPLQTLSLLQELLTKTVENTAQKALLSRFEETLDYMSAMLNGVIAIDQINGGAMRAEVADFEIRELLERFRNEFAYLAAAQARNFHVASSSVAVRGDPILPAESNRSVTLTPLSTAVRNVPADAAPSARSSGSRALDGSNDSKSGPVVFIVDDDPQLRGALRSVLEAEGQPCSCFGDCESFLRAYRPGRVECLLVDACLPGISGLQLIQRLREKGYSLPAIMMTGNGDVPMAVRAMQTGACDFLEKPVDGSELLGSIQRALEQSRDSQKRNRWRAVTLSRLERLTSREREIMQKVLAGEPSKNIAADFGLSQRTVENHRAAIMKKTGCKSIPALARLVIAANGLDQANIPDAKASLAEFVS